LLPIGTHCDKFNYTKIQLEPEKNEKLKTEREVSFEEIIFAIEKEKKI
jgi:hypothetical protein